MDGKELIEAIRELYKSLGEIGGWKEEFRIQFYNELLAEDKDIWEWLAQVAYFLEPGGAIFPERPPRPPLTVAPSAFKEARRRLENFELLADCIDGFDIHVHGGHVHTRLVGYQREIEPPLPNPDPAS